MAEGSTGWPQWSPAGARDADEIRRILDFRAERALRHFEAGVRGGRSIACPCCGYVGPFSPVRHKLATWCPQCDSRPRHRLLRLWMDQCLELPDNAEVLHFAAEPGVGAWFRERGARYRTADITDAFDLQIDIEATGLPDASVDLVIANHVLEHVDDGRALAELARILRPGGQAVLTVPLVAGWATTFEDPTLDADGRALRYGDPDHRRFYGRDFADRVAAAGLVPRIHAATEPDVSDFALQRGESIYIGRKAADDNS